MHGARGGQRPDEPQDLGVETELDLPRGIFVRRPLNGGDLIVAIDHQGAIGQRRRREIDLGIGGEHPYTAGRGAIANGIGRAHLERVGGAGDKFDRTSLCFVRLTPELAWASPRATRPKSTSDVAGSSVVHSTIAVLLVFEDIVGPERITGNCVSGSLLVVNDPAPPGGCSTFSRLPA
jgi:hypothetical protein